MTLRTEQVTAAIRQYGEGGHQGMAQALRRNSRTGTNASTLTYSQERFLHDLEHAPAPRRSTYVHPRDAATRPVGHGRRAPDAAPGRADAQQVSLTPSERAWLGMLPSNADAIAFPDAAQVLALARVVNDPGDQLLLYSFATPITEHHDTLEARTQLQNASQPLTPLPASALPALADSIAAATPELTAEEAAGRAHDQLTRIHQQKQQAKDDQASTARATLAAIDEARTRRTAPLRPAHP